MRQLKFYMQKGALDRIQRDLSSEENLPEVLTLIHSKRTVFIPEIFEDYPTCLGLDTSYGEFKFKAEDLISLKNLKDTDY